MTNKEIKLKFLRQLQSRDIWVNKVNDVQYLTRCPFCGDSANPNHGHFYIRINLEDNSNMVYYCHKCPARGIITKDTCERLDIDDVDMLSDIIMLNKTADKVDTKQIMGESFHVFDYRLPKPIYNYKIQYIENRLGIRLTEEDAVKLKIIPSFYAFLEENKINELTCSPGIAKILEENYVGFLSYGNSHILFRDVTGRMEYSWFKYPISRKSSENRLFYSISSQIDPFTQEPITINLCEGVMDAASICYNLGYNGKNTITIAVAGKYYEPIIRFIIGLGLFGSNVSINVFADNDAMFNKKNKAKDTDIDFYRKIFKNSKYLFKSVKVYYNLKEKDCGVRKEQIVLKEYKI